MKVFGERLRELRLERKMTQSAVGSILHVSANTIYAWENDKQEPSMTTLLKLCEIFNVSLDFLFGKTDF